MMPLMQSGPLADAASSAPGDSLRCACGGLPRRGGWRVSLALPVAWALLLALPVGAASLVVQAHGFADASGSARVAVYSSRMGFPDSPRYSEPQPAAPTARWQIDDLPTGDYAVLVWHDRDDDGVLDRSMFGAPREPYGYSNGVRGGDPDWQDVRVTLGPELLTVQVAVE